MSIVFTCSNSLCSTMVFGSFDGFEWRPSSKPKCECNATLDALCVCDWCGGRVYAKWDEYDGTWSHPNEFWSAFWLADWQAHGCTDEHFEAIKNRAAAERPKTTTMTVMGRNGLNVSTATVSVQRPGRLADSHVDLADPIGAGVRAVGDDRTPSDAFLLP